MASSSVSFSRQRDIVPPERLNDWTAVVLGVGAVGRQVAVMLAGVGVRDVLLVDNDKVGPENLGVQGWRFKDLGVEKSAAARDAMLHVNPEGCFQAYAGDARKTHSWTRYDRTVVFCCVDSIETRDELFGDFRAYAERPSIWIDGRMSGEVLRILTASRADMASLNRYAATLFSGEDAYQSPCTAKTTLHMASMAAAWMIHQFTRHIRDLPMSPDVMINALGGLMVDMPSEEEQVATC